MNLTEKERTLLQDMKSQEQLCIEKYNKYSQMAHDPELKNLFTSLGGGEQKHLETINSILSGTQVTMPQASPSAVNTSTSFVRSSCNEVEKKNDAYLCQDALSMEKHVSSVYNTGVFEFSDLVLRDTLAHIQKEEQNHGARLYEYMKCNNMYN